MYCSRCNNSCDRRNENSCDCRNENSCGRNGERILVNNSGCGCGENRNRSACGNTFHPGCGCQRPGQRPCPRPCPRPCSKPNSCCEDRCRLQYRQCMKNCRCHEDRDCRDFDRDDFDRRNCFEEELHNDCGCDD